ncbi:hypothetical protein L543_1089 [Bordetella hinzii L60]|nr:hypothetical protein L543_1089 [Bordetella hinzii L60]
MLGCLPLERGRLGRGRFLDPPGLVRIARALLAQGFVARPLDQPELDAARLQVHARNLHLHLVGQPVAHARALAAQFVQRIIELEILAAQLRDVHQALDMQGVQRHENTETGHAGDGAAEILADPLLDEPALEPGLDIARGLVGAPFAGRQDEAELFPDGMLMLALAAADDHRLGLQVGHIALAGQQGLDDAMREQIGIAPDGRSEVRIGRIGQAEMAHVVRAVDRLLHGAQAHGLQQREIRTSAHRIEELAVVLGRGRIATAQGQGHGAQEIAQSLQALGRRAFVDPVQPGMLAALHEVGRAGVGGQHAFFDELMGIVAHHGHDLFDTAQFVAHDARLDGFEVDGAALLALLRQQLVELVEMLHVRQQLAQRQRGRPAGLLQGLPDAGVGGARMRMHDGVVELIGGDRAGLGPRGRNHHVADQHQAVHVGIERAQSVGQRLRQHGDDAAREVHAGAALDRVVVQGVAGPHVVTDVGDGHQQPPAGTLALARAQVHRLAIDSVVKIARVFAVDGDQRHIAQIHALLEIAFAHAVGQARGLLARGLGELDGHIELAHRDFDFHAGIVDLAQHFEHLAQRLGMTGRLLDDLDRHHLPMLGAVGVARRNQDVVLDALVFGHHDGQPMLVQETPHEFVGAPLDHLDDGALGLAPVLARGLDQHAVAVQHLEHLARRQEDVRAAVIAHQETEAVAMALHAPGDKVQLGGQQQHALAVGQQLAIALHGGQPPLETHHGRFALDAHALGQLGGRQRRAGGAQGIQDLFARRDVRIEVRRSIGQDRCRSIIFVRVVIRSFCQS